MFGSEFDDVEDVGVHLRAERVGEQRGAQEAAEPGDRGPGGHHRAVREQAGLLGSLVDRRLGWSARSPAPGLRGLLVGVRSAVRVRPGRGLLGIVGSSASAGVRRASRTRRNSRSPIAPNSSAAPIPTNSQITLLTWAERIDMLVLAPSGVPRLSVTISVTSWMPFSSVRAVSRTVTCRLAGTSTRRGPVMLSRLVGLRVERDRDRLVEPVGDRRRELAARARQRDRARRADPHLAEPLVDPLPGPVRRRTVGDGAGPRGVRRRPERLVGDRAGDQVVEGEQVLQGRAAADQRCRRTRSWRRRARPSPARSGSAACRRTPARPRPPRRRGRRRSGRASRRRARRRTAPHPRRGSSREGRPS